MQLENYAAVQRMMKYLTIYHIIYDQIYSKLYTINLASGSDIGFSDT